MPVYTLKAPDGRQISIRANDEATALRGAKEWAAANPVQQPGNVASPSPEFQESMGRASQASQVFQKPEMRPDLMGATAATIGGAVNAIPVIGPMAQGISDNLVGLGAQLTGGDYNEARDAAVARRDALATANPVANIAGGLAGSLGAYGAAAKAPAVASALGFTGSTPARIGKSGASALGIGAADNMARGQAPVDAMANAAGPAAIAAAIPAAGAGIRAGAQGLANNATRTAQRKVTDAAIQGAPDAQDLKSVARSMFREVDNSGAAIKTDVVAQRIYQAAQKAGKELIDTELDAPAVRLYQIIAERTRQAYESGRGLALGEIHNMRQLAQDVVMKGKGDRTSRFAREVVDLIDDMVGNLKPSQMQFPPNRIGGNATDMGNVLLKGIGTWGRARRVDLIEEALYKAQNQASGVENGLRTQFRQLLQNPKTRNLFTAAEREAIEKVANGTNLSNLTRLLGMFGFDFGSGRNFVGGSIGLLLGGPVGMALGAGARKGAEKMAIGAGQRAANVVATPNIPIVAPRAPNQMLLQGADALERLGRPIVMGGT